MIGNAEQNTFREARSYGVGQIEACPVEPKHRDINDELTDLQDLVSKAHEMFTILEKKTHTIRLQTPQCSEKECNTIATHDGSEIRAHLADQNLRLRTLMRRMSVMIDEIDL